MKLSLPSVDREPLAVDLSVRTAVPSASSQWRIETHEDRWEGPGRALRVKATWRGDRPIQAGLVVRGMLSGVERPKVVIPAVFYGDNGPGSPYTRYPRLGEESEGRMTSRSWDFAAERTAVPAVFAGDESRARWMAVEPHGTGVGFSVDDESAELRIHRPGLERPFKHDKVNEAPVAPMTEVEPGGSLEVRLWVGKQRGLSASGIASVQRALQRELSTTEPRAIDRAHAAKIGSVAAHGLLDWHHRRYGDTAVLLETVSFDLAEVREAMHVSWISGAPTAFALMRHGIVHGDRRAEEAGRAVLDTVAGGLAPCGGFWGEWRPDGWRAGWNGDAKKLHARTLAEATLFMVRAIALEREAGREHPSWERAVKSNLALAMRAMDRSGHPGSYYHAESGEVLERRGTAGLLWAAALAEGAQALGEKSYLTAAKKIGRAYAAQIERGELFGAPEDIHLCPSSEDTYNALMATMALFEQTGERRWLDLAKRSADWLLTYRFSYDVKLPAGSPLAMRNFQTRGGDAASPSNHHLHDYGLICHRELVRLGELTGDRWYADRAQDHLACFLDQVALADGPEKNDPKRGMLPEQFYTAEWSASGRKGDVGRHSHAWCLGLLVLGIDDWLSQRTGGES